MDVNAYNALLRAAATPPPSAAWCRRLLHASQALPGYTRCLTPLSLALQVVIQKAKLNNRVLEMFEETEHESLLAGTADFEKWEPAPLLSSRNGPLGYTKPAWE